MATYRNKCPAPGIEPGHGRPELNCSNITQSHRERSTLRPQLSVSQVSVERRQWCISGVNDKRPNVYWDQKSQDVRQGDNVTMTCTVTGVTLLDVVRLTHQVTDDNSTSTSTRSSIVADNDVVKETFLALGRYRVLYHVINDTATLQLRIRGTFSSRTCLSVCLRCKSFLRFFAFFFLLDKSCTLSTASKEHELNG